MVAPWAASFERRGVGMDRDEQIGVEPAGDLVALVEAAIAVVLAGHRHPDPAGGGERVADGEAEREGDVLLALGDERRGGAGIVAAMAGIDHHQRRIVAARRGHPGQRPQLVGAERVERDGDAGRAAGRRRADPGDQARAEDREQQGSSQSMAALCRAARPPVQRKTARGSAGIREKCGRAAVAAGAARC